MASPNQAIVDRYFDAYSRHDLISIGEVMSEKVKWYFLGKNPFAGVKNGITQVVTFFDTMARLMGDSRPTISKLIVCENENHLIECIHTKSNRQDGINIDHYACVLWTFQEGKIIEGRHFFADPEAVDNYFNAVAKPDQHALQK